MQSGHNPTPKPSYHPFMYSYTSLSLDAAACTEFMQAPLPRRLRYCIHRLRNCQDVSAPSCPESRPLWSVGMLPLTTSQISVPTPPRIPHCTL